MVRYERGNSLIELLTAAAVMLILSGAAVLAASRLSVPRLTSESRKLRDLIQSLAIRSREQGQEKTLVIGRNSYSTTELDLLPGGHRNLDDIEISAPQSTLSFFPNGVAVPSTITLKLYRTGQCRLIISLHGRCTATCN